MVETIEGFVEGVTRGEREVRDPKLEIRTRSNHRMSKAQNVRFSAFAFRVSDVGVGWFSLFLLAYVSLCSAAEPTVDPKELPRTPPVEPAQALSTFKVRPGFHLELVAAEPLVIDPIAMSFDENGRLFVVEMRDYSERREERLGRIRKDIQADADAVSRGDQKIPGTQRAEAQEDPRRHRG